MAMMRCAFHKPIGRTHNYVAGVEPVGFPATAVVCGIRACSSSALIWLDDREKDDFDGGERIFRSFTAAMKVRAAEPAH